MWSVIGRRSSSTVGHHCSRCAAADVNRKPTGVMLSDVIRRQTLALLFSACVVTGHFNLYMNETETWRLLGKPVR